MVSTQGGFREARSSLDQVQWLIEICSTLRRTNHPSPTLAFLDIKSAYDTVDRSYIWRTLQPHLCPALLGILKNLFDHVQIEILLDNRVSYRLSPVTGVLQGSILSPFLYSIYINRLPAILRQPFLLDNSFSGYRWNPVKCVIVAPTTDAQTYHLYDTPIPKNPPFHTWASLTMNQLAAIGLNSKDFPPLLACRFYSQIVRAQLDYGLAISPITAKLIQRLVTFQNSCIRRIFGGHARSSVQLMLHLANLPSMRTRVASSSSPSHWYKLSTTRMWRSLCAPIISTLDSKEFYSLRTEFLEQEFHDLYTGFTSILLASTRPTTQVDSILWLSMTCSERSRVFRW
ncbi:hypothetical protein INT46_001805 [Mucor plumbeus]|uniref:Reverse transcriptase domain-containing protein n=1 Tax=Mucor plumbeus TaxID=97098 RepID=A0A8H7QR81_9FUNG|nr:hypothetical protein INT46_001805 [Mucor plumbeus]